MVGDCILRHRDAICQGRADLAAELAPLERLVAAVRPPVTEKYIQHREAAAGQAADGLPHDAEEDRLLERSGEAEQPASAACSGVVSQESSKQRVTAELLAQKQELLAKLQAAKAAALSAQAGSREQAPGQAGSVAPSLQPAEHADSCAATLLLGQPDELSRIAHGLPASSTGQASGCHQQMAFHAPADELSTPQYAAASPDLAPEQAGETSSGNPFLQQAELSNHYMQQQAAPSHGWGILRFKRGPSAAAREAVHRMQQECIGQFDECEKAAARARARQEAQ